MIWIQPSDVEQRLDAGYYDDDAVHAHRLALAAAPQHTTLGELAPNMCNGPHGGVTYVERGGVRYIRAKNLDGLTVTNDAPVFIPEEVHKQNMRAEVVPGDVLITITGANIGAVAIVPESIPKANIIQSLAKARIETSADPFYVAGFLTSRVGEALIRRESVNTAREGINFEYLARVPVPIPRRQTQAALGNLVRRATRLRELAEEALAHARASLDAFSAGTLDEDQLVGRDSAVRAWLASNPHPNTEKP